VNELYFGGLLKLLTHFLQAVDMSKVCSQRASLTAKPTGRGDTVRILLCVFCLAGGFVLAALAPASATGTLRIQQHDGSTKTYQDVKIRVSQQKLRITSADGEGTLVISKAACSYTGKLMVCLPYTLSLEQNGKSNPLDFYNGTVYINTGSEKAPLPFSSQQVPPNGIVFAMHSKIGTVVTLEGKLDEVSK
jgi:hypothetical protein